MTRVIQRLLLLSFLLLCFLISSIPLLGQGWRTNVGLPNVNESGIMVRNTHSGGFIGLGLGANNYLFQLDQLGDTLWTNQVVTSPGWFGRDVFQTADSGFVITGNLSNSTFLIRTDPQGDTLWTRLYSNWVGFWGNSVRETPDGGLVVTAWSTNYFHGFPLFKTNSVGDTLWSQGYFAGNFGEGHVVENTLEGGFIAVGQVTLAPGQSPVAIKTNSNGDSLWAHVLNLGPTESGYYADIEQLPDSGYILTGSVIENNSNAYEVLLVRLDKFGDTLWTRRTNVNNYASGIGVAAAPDGGFAVLQFQASGGGINLMKFDSTGNQLWTRTYLNGEVNYRSKGGLSLTPDGGYVLIGTHIPFNGGLNDALVIKTDSLGYLYPNLLTGRLYRDEDNNCVPAANEVGLQGWIMHAENTSNGAQFYAVTDSNGYYEIAVDTGVIEYGPDTNAIYSGLWGPSSCSSPTQTHTFLNPQDTAQYDFPQQPLADCPLLVVDIFNPRIRRCIQSSYYVHYQNLGTATAILPRIEVDFGPDFTIDSASVPWAVMTNNNHLEFILDSLEVYGSGTIQIYVTLDAACNSTVIGETRCATAHIYPDSICLPTNPNWDGSSVAVTADCQNDSLVRLAAYNNGTNNMVSPSHVIIVEDNILRLDTNVTLIAGDSMVWFKPGNGSTWYIQADQSPGHPGLSFPSAFVEGCGQNGSGGISMGYAIGLPLDNANPFVSIHCGLVNGSFDPNAKIVSPGGRGPDHLINQGQRLTYTLQFQNTGNDTAFKVVVIDTLPPGVNPATLVSGVSSHPYTFDLYGDGIARWTFEDIMLPDSNTNEPASQGFVHFNIEQTDNLPLGTRINNAVGIYFDRNAPILTDTAWVTLGEDQDYVVVSLDPGVDPSHSVQVYPNPFSSTATIALSQIRFDVELKVFDLQGKLVESQKSPQTDRLTIHADQLPEGVYVFRLISEGSILSSGRLSVIR